MPDWTLVNRSHVMAALAEYDRLGSREFLSRYSFGRSKAYTLWHGGQEYDPKAILGVAYLHATGRAATRDEFRGELSGAVRLLQGLGFDVVVDEEELEQEERRERARPVSAPAAPRGTTQAPSRSTSRVAPAAKRVAKTTRAKPIHVPVKVCPTCYTALPATGICDYCD